MTAEEKPVIQIAARERGKCVACMGTEGKKGVINVLTMQENSEIFSVLLSLFTMGDY